MSYSRSLVYSGTGKVICGEIGSNSIIRISDAVFVKIDGGVGENVVFIVGDAASVKINGQVSKSVKFNLSDAAKVIFTQRPPEAVVKRISCLGRAQVEMPGEYRQQNFQQGNRSNSYYGSNNDSIVIGGSNNVVSNNVISTNKYKVTTKDGSVEIKRKKDGNSSTYRGNNVVIQNGHYFIDGVEVQLSDANEKVTATIEAVYSKLVRLTNAYLGRSSVITSKSELLQSKQNDFESLKVALEAPEDVTKLQRIAAFKRLLETIDEGMISTHRTADWKRYVYNVFSVLTVIPAFVRVGISYSKYGTFQFWKPDSKKAFIGAKSEMKKINKLDMVNSR